MAEPIDRFFKYGSQYYAAGRYAAFASLIRDSPSAIWKAT